MKGLWSLICVTLSVTSCVDFPKDPNDTLLRTRSEGSFRVGVMTAPGSAAEGEITSLLTEIGKEAGAAPELLRGEPELMLSQLEEGKLDLVVGWFDKKSPWMRRVTIGPPLKRKTRDRVEFHLAPAMRNGENAWISLVEAEVRDLAPQAQ